MATTMEVAVVFDQRECYVDAMVESHDDASASAVLSLELLQFQLFSLVGVAPDEQTLLSSRGEVLVSGAASPQQQLVVRLEDERRPRLFLLANDVAATARSSLPSDWQQICSASAFSDVPVVQPAFEVLATGTTGASDAVQLVCHACAMTCTTAARPVSPLDWFRSRAISEQFISDVCIVTGALDVAPPRGFVRLPGDLAYGASGDHAFLCVKRGDGARALTHLSVQLPDAGPSGHVATRVALTTESVYRKSVDALTTLAITDVRVVIGDARRAPSPMHIRLPGNLAAHSGADAPVHVWYALAPLGGFVCDARSGSHSGAGECLFALRHATSSVLDAARAQAAVTVATKRIAQDNAMLQSVYERGEREMTDRLEGTLARVQTYERKAMQDAALQCIPVVTLHERVRAAVSEPPASPMYQDELLRQLVHWFKREFFTWMNAPACATCRAPDTQLLHTEPPQTPEEVQGQASRVEVYMCRQCRTTTRFPRHNNPVTLLQTRTGRCGEWANCFTLCCRAMGFEARYVLDVTDHVWTEVYSHAAQRWLHCDACEDQVDCPLTYEVGWGKQLSYIFSVSHEDVVDAARRYTQDWDAMRARRQDVSERWLAATIDAMNARLQRTLPPARQAIVRARAVAERDELARGRTAQASEVQGRVSGSAEWKSQRSEDGQQRRDPATAGAGASTSSAALTDRAALTVERSQQLCETLLLGCGTSECPNPYCRHGQQQQHGAGAEPIDMTDHAARMLQLVASFTQRGFTPESLASLLCPRDPSALSWCVLTRRPVLYLQLQDADALSDTSERWLADSSGHERHTQNASHCPLRKPFAIPQRTSSAAAPALSFGTQLLPGQSLQPSFALPASSSGTYALSFLVRMDASDSATSERVDVLRLLLDEGRTVVSLATSKTRDHDVACEVRATGASPTLLRGAEIPKALLAFGAYAHVGLVRSLDAVTLYVNAVEVVTAKCPAVTPASGCTMSLEVRGPERDASTCVAASATAVISHLAVFDEGDKDGKDTEGTGFVAFCAMMKQHFVQTAPLGAHSADGACADKRCDVDAANAQLHYRVARIKLWGSEFFDGIQFEYEALERSGEATPRAVVAGPLIGNALAVSAAAAPTVTLALASGEVVTGVSGRKGAWTDSLCLETSFGRSVTCGGTGGGAFHVTLPHGSEVRAVAFAVGDHLVDPIAYVGDATAAAREACETEELKRLQDALKGSDATQRRNAIAAALKYLENLVKQPQDARVKKILATNAFFTKNIAALGDAACRAFMRWCGFAPLDASSDDAAATGKTFFVLMESAAAAGGDRCSSDDAAAAAEQLVAETLRRIHLLKRFSQL